MMVRARITLISGDGQACGVLSRFVTFLQATPPVSFYLVLRVKFKEKPGNKAGNRPSPSHMFFMHEF